jgi:hypothetical protein
MIPAPTSPTGDPAKVVLSGKGLKHAHLDKPAVFGIDGRNAGPGLYFQSNKLKVFFQCKK